MVLSRAPELNFTVPIRIPATLHAQDVDRQAYPAPPIVRRPPTPPSSSHTAKTRNVNSLCLIPDLPNAPRLQVRPAHMEGAITSVLNRDFIVMGGAYLTHHPPPPADGSALADEDIPFAGSAMVVVAASEDEVLRRIRDDPYAKRGVWDVDRARIWS